MTPDIHLEESWKDILSDEFDKEYFRKLKTFLASERQKHLVYPPKDKVFEAFRHTPFSKVKVIILGQDPYHGPGQAHGLSFSVPEGIAIPPSLRNIFKELQQEFGLNIPQKGNLEAWADQGVFLLNATLTVRANEPGSHQKKGWEIFTNAVIQNLSEYRSNLVFLLWGNFARSKKELIDTKKHYVLEAPHPSPFSARKGFFGCNHFKKTNEILQQQGQKPIDWQIE
ncbi:MAG: uracil-DNA glycosylase [Bacteroidales bacterium]|nr:uracil-DNA glycosylase [Bacteroidales bacterium]MCF8327513.1 uracil-DNA glycosylase [Bacteroidales bacterium]